MKKEMLNRLTKLDDLSEANNVDKSHSEERYGVEAQLEHIYKAEKIFCQQKSKERWLLTGDANTTFFHTCANGRRRKIRICSLDTDDGLISS
jgi:hypothetical protein